MNMNYSELESLLEKIKECVEFYEKTYIKNKVYDLYLGNGQKIRYIITPGSLPHLLCIKDLNLLKQGLYFKSDNILEILKELPEKAYTIHNNIKNGLLNSAFSKYINVKVENFMNNLTSNADKILDETLFVCSYKSERSWEHTTKNQKYDYIIVKKTHDGKIALLCLVKNGTQYYAMSNQTFENEEEAKADLTDLLKNQEITLLTGISIQNTFTDNMYKKTLTINQKIEKNDIMKTYKTNFDCYMDISSDYKYTVNKLRSNKYEKIGNADTIEDFVNAIVEQKLITREPYEDSIFITLVDAWNDHICNASNEENKNTESYSEVVKQLNNLKRAALQIKEDNLKLENEVNILKRNNQELTEENKNQKETINKVFELTKPRS